MQIKFEAAELEGGSYLGEGEHECAITKVESKVSKAGKPMLEIEFRSKADKTCRDWFTVEGNKFKLAALAMASGTPKETLLSRAFDTASLHGKFVKVVREVVGKDEAGKNRYENYYKPSGVVPSTHGRDEIPF